MSESSIPSNRGAAVPDTQAMGSDQEAQRDWLQKQKVNINDRIRLKKLSHIRYQNPNLDETHDFMLDFGMRLAKRTEDEIWYRGYGPDQYVYYTRRGPKKFLGGTFEAETQEDFEKWVLK